jgi:PIN domain nuclease of toxin-antitoxin system
VRLLLDSHVALWWLGDHADLADSAHAAITEADQVLVSVVTPWELGIKRVSGKLTMPDDLVSQLVASGFEILPVSAAHAIAAPQLPAHHGDPFDRMLIAQAIIERLTIVTADHQFKRYNVDVIEARSWPSPTDGGSDS